MSRIILTTSRVSAFALSTALVAALSACASDEPKARNVLPVVEMSSYQPTLSTSVPQLMDSMELDIDNGVDVDYQPTGTSSSATIASLLARDVDFAMAARNAAFDAATKNDDIVVLGTILGRGSVSVLSNEAIAKIGLPADASDREKLLALKGLTIASSPEGSGTNLELRRLLEEVGLDPDKDVKIIGVTESSALVAGISRGRFDGGFFASGVMEANVAKGEADYWLSVPRGDLKEFTKPGAGGVIVTRRDVIEDMPEVVESVYQALADASALINSDPDLAGSEIREKWLAKLPEDVFKLAWGETVLIIPETPAFPRSFFDSAIEDVHEGADELDYEDLVYQSARD